MEVRKIECPSCGSNSTFKVSEGEYKCNYCQSNFSVIDHDRKKNGLNDLNELVETLRKERKSASFRQMTASRNKSKRLSLVIFTAMMLFMAGIFGFVFISVKRTVGTGSDAFGAWQAPSQKNYQCFLGSKGPVIFIFSQQSRGRLDSVRYFVKLIDPKTKKVLTDKQFGATLPWKSLFNFSDRFESDFDCFNDIAYNTPKDSGLIGYDIYTFNEVVTTGALSKKFPELSSGIAKASYSDSKGGFKLKTNTAEEFIFDPLSRTLSKKGKHPAVKKDTLVTQLYLSSGNRPQLYLIKRKIQTGDNDTRLNDGFVENYEKNTAFYKSSFRIQSMDKVTEKIFFMAQVLGRYKNNLVILYTTDLSKNTPVLMECIDRNGQTLWQNNGRWLQPLKERNTPELHCNYKIKGADLVVTSFGNGTQTHGIDLETGKTSWEFLAE